MAMSQSPTRAMDLQVDATPNVDVAFDLAGWSCRIVCLGHAGVRPADAEGNHGLGHKAVAHFELGERAYALTADAPVHIVQDDACASALEGGREDVHALLTNRELQIVQLICMGLLTKQVADRLRLSEFTVRSYLKNVYCKLGVRSRGAMVYEYTQALARMRPTGADRSDAEIIPSAR